MNDYLCDLFSLEGKAAIVTGGARGIGAEIAMAYKKAGANVVCVSRSECPNNKNLEDNYKQCDILDYKGFRLICEQTFELYGNIDILVNAAGITLPYHSQDDKYENFLKTISVNLNGAYLCSDIVSKFMQHGGSIINITSIGSILGFPDNPGYVASKGGVRTLTKALAVDFSKKNIRVNNIVPGYIKTEMTKKSYNDSMLYKERLNRMIIKRWGSVDDIIGAAIFLASNSSSYVTGIDLVVDGGWLAKGL